MTEPELDLPPSSSPPPPAASSLPVAQPGSWRTFLPELLARIFGVRSLLNVWQFAEAKVVLSPIWAPGHSGPYRVARTPPLRWLMEQFTNPAWHEIVIKKSSQSGVTEAILNFLRWLVANRPSNVLYVIDSVDEVKNVFRRLIDTLQRIPETAQQFTDNEDDATSRKLFLRDMFILGVGGHSAGALANKAVTVGILDEVDKHPPSPGGEGSTINQVRARFKTVPRSLLIVLSKPVDADGPVSTEFETGTQHRCFIQCPHCGEGQVFVKERIVYSHCKDLVGDYDRERILREAYYQCTHAGTDRCPDGKITEAQRRAQLLAERFEWRQTNFKAVEPGKLTVEITDFLSLWENMSLGVLALKLLKAQTSLAEMKHVNAEHFAEGWKRTGAALKVDEVLRLRSPYRRGTLPVRPDLVVVTADVQGYGEFQKWMKHGFVLTAGGTLHHYVIDWGATPHFDALLDVAAGRDPEKPVRVHGSDETFVPAVGIIDEGDGNSTKQVRDFIERAWSAGSSPGWFTAKGRGGFQVRALVWESEYHHPDEFGQPRLSYHFHDDALKQELFHGQIKGNAKIIKGESRLPRLHFPEDMPADIAEEFTHEQLVPKEQLNGYTKMVWEKSGPNEWPDNVKMAKVVWQVLGERIAAEKAAAVEKAAREATSATRAN